MRYVSRWFIPETLASQALVEYATARRFEPEKFLDKCYYLIDRLYIGRLLREEQWTDYVPIHSQVLGQVLTTHHAPHVKRALIQTGVIETNLNRERESYAVGYYSKEYRFTKEFRNAAFRAIAIRDVELLQRLRLWGERSSAYHASKSFGRTLIHNSCRELDFDGRAARLLIERKPFEDLHQENWWIRCVETLESGDWRFVADGQGRIYHSLTNLPRELRQFVTWRGRELYQIDVSSSHPCLLARRYYNECEEKKRWIKEVQAGRFYTFLNSRLKMPHNFEDETEYAAFKKEVFHRIVYSSNYSDPSELSDIFQKEFPILTECIWLAKSRHQRDLSKELQRIESQIVIDGAATQFATTHKDEDVFLGSIHDCLISTEEFTHQLRKMLQEGYERVIGFRPLVRIKSFSGVGNAPALIRPSESDLFETARRLFFGRV